MVLTASLVLLPLIFTGALAGRVAAQDIPSLSGPANDPLATAKALVRDGNLAEAEAAARNFVETHLVSGEGHFLLGLILFREHKSKESLAEYTEGSKYQLPSAADLKVVGLDYVLLDDYPDAEKWLTESTQGNAADPIAWYSLGRVQYKLNHFDGALVSFQKALELDPRNVKAEDNLGLAYQGLGRAQEAIASYRQAIAWQATADHPSEQPLLNLGSLLIERDDLQEATRLLESAVGIAPDNAKAQEQLGRAYLAQSNLGLAAQHLERAVALSPDDSRLHFQLGQVYRKQGLTDKAKAEFARTEALNGTKSTRQ